KIAATGKETAIFPQHLQDTKYRNCDTMRDIVSHSYSFDAGKYPVFSFFDDDRILVRFPAQLLPIRSLEGDLILARTAVDINIDTAGFRLPLVDQERLIGIYFPVNSLAEDIPEAFADDAQLFVKCFQMTVAVLPIKTSAAERIAVAFHADLIAVI